MFKNYPTIMKNVGMRWLVLLRLPLTVRYGHLAIVLLLLGYNAEVEEGVAEGVVKAYKAIVRALLERKTDRLAEATCARC